MEEKMTIFYMRSSGNIKHVITDVQDFSLFGSEADDYESILARVIANYDDFIFRNSTEYKVIDGQLVFMRS